ADRRAGQPAAVFGAARFRKNQLAGVVLALALALRRFEHQRRKRLLQRFPFVVPIQRLAAFGTVSQIEAAIEDGKYGIGNGGVHGFSLFPAGGFGGLARRASGYTKRVLRTSAVVSVEFALDMNCRSRY